MKTKKKPKYSLGSCVSFMVKTAWNKEKRVLWVCMALIGLQLSQSLVQLYVAPMVLRRVENHAPLGELLLTIGGFSLLLFVLTALNTYIEKRALYGRVSVRSSLVNAVNVKSCTTAYPNTRDAQALKLQQAAMNACGSNSEPAEHIWMTLMGLVTNLGGFVIYLVLLSALPPLLIGVVVLTSAIGFLVSKRINQWEYRHKDQRDKYLEEMLYIQRKSRSIELAKDIRIFGLKPWLTAVYDSSSRLYEAFITKRERIYIWTNVVDVVLSLARNGIAYVYLILMTLENGLPASEFLLYFTALSGFTAWVTGILSDFSTLYQEGLGISQVREYLDLPEPFQFEGGKHIPKSESYTLSLDGVSFKYPGSEQYVVRDLHLTIHPGENLAVVGLNGAGKTTLVRLLCGFYDPDEGRVLLNGQDIREFNRREYYKLFSAVFQEYSLLDVSMEENVAQSVTEIDRGRVEQCLEQAGLRELVHSLPQGTKTHVGREVYLDGVLLSGGETQRLMLARALYKDGGILVLDEPTAALDPIAENDIYLKYNEMTAGKTSVFISHRLASTRFCDRIIFLENGSIIEEGTHEELMKLGGAYAKLFDVQARYYQEGGEFHGEEN